MDAYARIAAVFDQSETAQEFLRDDGEGGLASGVSRMVDEIEALRAIVTDAIPFIGYTAHVPDIKARAEAAVNYPDRVNSDEL